MSTTRAALLVLVAACSSKKSAPPPDAPCLPGEIFSSGTGTATIDGLTAYACWGERCLTLDREGTAIGVAVRPDRPVAPRIPTLKNVAVFSPDGVDVRDAKTQTVVASFPTAVAAQETHQISDTRVLFRGAGKEPWTLLDLVSGASIAVGEADSELQVIAETTAVVWKGNKLIAVNAARMAATTPFTVPGRVAMTTAWFDRIFLVLDHPAGTAQIDPATGTYYSGPALPICK